MRQPVMFIDRGDGWENITGHEGSKVALDGFTVDWGTDGVDTQPDCNVLRFQLLDRTGTLAGNATTLAGMPVLVQLSRMPMWKDLRDPKPWGELPESVTWGNFHLLHTPDPTEAPDPSALTLFMGNITAGGTITQRDNGTYLLDLYANSPTVRMNRTTQQGPTSGELPGLHWVGDTAARVGEINRRLDGIGCPPIDMDSVAWVKANAPYPAPYELDSMPELSTVLHKLTAASPDMPLWFETHHHGGENITAVLAAAKASITLHSDGHLSVDGAGMSMDVLDASDIMIDESTLTLPDPIAQVTVKTKKAKWNDNDSTMSFEDAEVTITDRGRLPQNLTETIESVSFESDAVSVDESGGHWPGTVWNPTEGQRDQWADWLATQTLKPIPEHPTISSRNIDIDLHEETLQPSAILLAFASTRYTKLLDSQGSPVTSGAWLAIGGTLSFQWTGGAAELRNELTITPLPMLPSELSTWGDVDPLPIPWPALTFTWGEFSQITYFKE